MIRVATTTVAAMQPAHVLLDEANRVLIVMQVSPAIDPHHVARVLDEHGLVPLPDTIEGIAP